LIEAKAESGKGVGEGREVCVGVRRARLEGVGETGIPVAKPHAHNTVETKNRREIARAFTGLRIPQRF
jgi:hypothetical protein